MQKDDTVMSIRYTAQEYFYRRVALTFKMSGLVSQQPPLPIYRSRISHRVQVQPTKTLKRAGANTQAWSGHLPTGAFICTVKGHRAKSWRIKQWKTS